MADPVRVAFQARLFSRREGRGWTALDLPDQAAEVLGRKPRIAVVGTLNGSPFRSTVVADGKGHLHLIVSRAMCEAAGVRSGDEVKAVLEPAPARGPESRAARVARVIARTTGKRR